MDPITGIGAAASIVQLLTLCANASRATRDLWDSYADAPAELRRLTTQIEMLQHVLQQIHDLGKDLSAEKLDDLFPSTHRLTITTVLQDHARQLQDLRSFQRSPEAITSKLRWATLDKGKALRLLRAITVAEGDLTTCLAIANARLQLLNNTSLGQMLAYQSATLPALEALSYEIRSCVQTTINHNSAALGQVREFFRIYDDGRREIPFDRTTLFYENIATELGRKQMSQFPFVRALCNALQLAGYRAEMGDDDGEIWFEDGDGERYHDAREYQPAPGEDDGVVANCRICQDPRKHGLDYILERAKVGEDFVDEWREKQRNKKPSNTPRFSRHYY
ncbi:hypothetical protein B0T21DRAFT_453661 [Apiosordaria backusii]|uniref:Fungal N-terminal domain-containing protein n=1 Tax=Apiosordaria backusii TaxID=314023 RepID=A0AA40DYL7_9PEZI|nr:hypothetical protein B0T21DRAFT_453661 [Apiosordaria backusii]